MKTRKNDLESGFTLIETIVALVVVAIVAAMMSSFFGTSITQSSAPINRLNTSARLQETMQIITAQYIQSAHWRPNTTYAAGTTILPTTAKRTGLKYITNSGGTSGSTEPGTGSTTPWPVATGGTVTEGSVTWTQNGAAPTLINQIWRPGKPYPKNSIVINGSYQYITSDGGISGATPPSPSWGITSGWTGYDTMGTTNYILWKYSGPAPTVILQSLIGTAGAAGETETDYPNKTFGSDTVSYRVIENKFIKFMGNVEENINANPDDGQYGMYLKVTIGHLSNASDRTAETVTTLFAIR